jgi:hypothetical protein
MQCEANKVRLLNRASVFGARSAVISESFNRPVLFQFVTPPQRVLVQFFYSRLSFGKHSVGDLDSFL